mmetsp:Transcript_9082/g.31262  ORF Transcript_9082/g.31262 Transcript_9082/m.31262 type:complete len:207 (-) Transcript_9082:66-686(-)
MAKKLCDGARGARVARVGPRRTWTENGGAGARVHRHGHPRKGGAPVREPGFRPRHPTKQRPGAFDHDRPTDRPMCYLWSRPQLTQPTFYPPVRVSGVVSAEAVRLRVAGAADGRQRGAPLPRRSAAGHDLRRLEGGADFGGGVRVLPQERRQELGVRDLVHGGGRGVRGGLCSLRKPAGAHGRPLLQQPGLRGDLEGFQQAQRRTK